MAKGILIQPVSSSSPGQYKDVNGGIWTITATSGGFAGTTANYQPPGYTGSTSRTGATEAALYDTIDAFADATDPATGKPKKSYLPWILGGGALAVGLFYFSGGMGKKRKK